MTKVSLSWLDLKPNQDIHGNQEEYLVYIDRIRKVFSEYNHVPEDVFEQWLWAHHGNYETLINYAWINYENVEFILEKWTNEQLIEVNVIDEYSEYVKGRASFKDINEFCCTDKDLSSWINSGTWTMPPIILDVSTIKEEIPNRSDIKAPFQLVEGHSRFGYLKSMFNLYKKGKATLELSHSVYIMKITQPQKEVINNTESSTIKTNNVSLTAEEIQRIVDELEKEI